MRLIFSTPFIYALLVQAVAVQPVDRHRLKESIDTPPQGWIQSHPAPADHVIHLSIALPQPNFAELERHLLEVSDPRHQRYGAHLSKAEVEDLVRPSQESIEAVQAWLALHGLGSDDLTYSSSQDWLTIKVPVSLAEKMLDTEYHVWTHAPSGHSAIRTTKYSVPRFVHDHVELIQPTTLFSRFDRHETTSLAKRSFHSAADAAGDNASGITLSQIRQLYGASSYTPSASNGNSFAVTGYDSSWDPNSDLQAFYKANMPGAAGSTYNLVAVNGGLMSQNIAQAAVEAAIDMQLGFGSVFPTPATFYTVGGQASSFSPDLQTVNNTNEPYLDWLNYMLGLDSIPQTISTSYGDDEDTVPFSYAQRVCNGFAQLGARGASLIFSSGDWGAGDGDASAATQQCKTTASSKTAFVPQFPASCPYVTVVGATTGTSPEIAANFSGGGFSNYFLRPDYQDDAVIPYLSQIPSSYAGLYNPIGRAIPDVASQGLNIEIVFQGKTHLSGGTSTAAPVFAGLISNLNDARISQDLPPLGFLNPWLYSTANEFGGFTDIVSGNAPGCGTEGFSATSGWDAITGLGTARFSQLLSAATA